MTLVMCYKSFIITTTTTIIIICTVEFFLFFSIHTDTVYKSRSKMNKNILLVTVLDFKMFEVHVLLVRLQVCVLYRCITLMFS